jgi:hypothetical protein
MSSNHKNDNNVGQWIGIAIVFCIAWPIGLILAGIKVYKMYQSNQAQKSWQQTRQNWEQVWRNQNMNTNQQREDYQSQQYTQTSYQTGYQTSYQTNRQYNPQGNSAAQRQKLIAKLISPKSGRAMSTGGGIAMGLGIFGAVSYFLDNLWMISYGMLLDLISEMTGLFLLIAVGGMLLYIGTRKIKKARKYREYFAIIGQNQAVSLRQLAASTGTDYQTLCDDLSVLLDKGVFGPNAYLDLSTQHLILGAGGAQQVENQKQAAAQAAAKQASEAAARKAEAEDPSTALLKEIRRVNDDIPDPHLSQQIDRIEEITRQILQYQKGHPESAPQLHSFLSYYLPTTLKILNAYAEMEKQSIQGRNITETRQRIEKMMDKVVSGFETQLDQLYAGDRMDITSDISVLEQMLAQDGLTSDFDMGFTQTQN